MKDNLKQYIQLFIPNLAYVVGIFVLILRDLNPLAFGLVVVSKWQMLIGGPRLWLSNIRDNACDLVVSFSSVALLILYNDFYGQALFVQVGIATLYYVWLVAIKPRAGLGWRGVQALVAQLSGFTALYLFASRLPLAGTILLSWLIAVVAADHFFSTEEEPAHPVLVFVWGLIVAQLAWVFGRWLVVYSILGGEVLIPQAALVITITGYMLGNMYVDHVRKTLRKFQLVGYSLLTFGLFIVVIAATEWTTKL